VSLPFAFASVWRAPLQWGPARGAGGSGRPVGRLRCDARGRVAPQNSLRAPWALRSDSCGESVLDARCARRPRPCASRRSRRHPSQATTAAAKFVRRCLSATGSRPAKPAAPSPTSELELGELRSPLGRKTLARGFLHPFTTLLSAGGGGLWRACGSPRSAGGEARARSALRLHARGSCLSVAPEGRAASSAAGPCARAPQGSRPLGPTGTPKRRSPPPFAERETVDTCWQTKTPAISKTKHH
jgi:hypothetical protein